MPKPRSEMVSTSGEQVGHMPGVPGSGIATRESDADKVAYIADGKPEDVDAEEPETQRLPLRMRCARRFTSKALRTLVRSMDDPDAGKATAAAKAILAEGWGAPGQRLEVATDTLRGMSDQDLRELVRAGLSEIREKLEGRVVADILPIGANTVESNS